MRFIHMADAHLGMQPDKGCTWSEERGAELWKAFERVIDLCAEEKVDLLMIAGDLFHRQPSMADIKEVRYLFSKLGRTRVVLLAGNHDYLSASSRYPELELGERVSLLQGEEVTSVLIPSCNTTVYGVSYTGRTMKENLLQGVHPHRTRGYHILMAHGGDASHLPFDRRELMSAGFDYVALGHIHKPEQYGSRMAYAGSPEPLDHTETGEHGVILGELTEDGCQLRLIPLAVRQYRELMISVTPEITHHALADRIEEQIQRYGKQDMYRVIIKGYHDPQAPISAMQIQDLLQKRDVRIVDILSQSCPYYDFEQLIKENRNNLLGQFLLRVQALDRDASWKEKVMAAGVQALEENESSI